MKRRSYIAAGNWKMHGLAAELDEIGEIARAAAKFSAIQSLMCLPATLIDRARGTGIALGGQDCHPAAKGAHTGDISADMLAEAGANYVIVGHSERRADHDENDAMVAAKTYTAWQSGLTAVICIGETEVQYRAGTTLEVLAAQIRGSVPKDAKPGNTIIAYEPVWAIGTGLTPKSDEIQIAHAAIRAELKHHLPEGAQMSILYGGSLNPGNAAEIFALKDVDGGLVGGASLKASDFVPIMRALNTAKEMPR